MLGVRGTYTAAQVRAIRSILADCDGVIRWGGDYAHAPVDEMHFEINENAAAVATLAHNIREEHDMPTADEIVDALLGQTLGRTGPNVAVALQDGYRNSITALAKIEALEAQVAELVAAVKPAAAD